MGPTDECGMYAVIHAMICAISMFLLFVNELVFVVI